MEIPNSIVIFLDNDPRWYDATRFRKFDKSSLQEYIRKDLLLAWAEQEKSKTSIGLSEYDAGHENGRMELLNDLIDKISTL